MGLPCEYRVLVSLLEKPQLLAIECTDALSVKHGHIDAHEP